jgi:hypothetical protein
MKYLIDPSNIYAKYAYILCKYFFVIWYYILIRAVKQPNKIFYVGDAQKIFTLSMKIFIMEIYSFCSKLVCNLG